MKKTLHQHISLSHYTAIVSLIILISACISSCSDPTAWYPEGKACIVSNREIVNTCKQCDCTIGIKNEGKSKISRSTVSITFTTNTETYYATVISEIGILSGGTIYSTVTIPYLSTNETLIVDGATINDEFYE